MLHLISVLASIAASVSAQQCPAGVIGPGAQLRNGTGGAQCLLSAFQDGCRKATYTLSSLGVDTVHVETFRTVALAGGRCGVVVIETERIVPRPAHELDRRTCLRLRRTAFDIVTDRCTKPGLISLTKLPGR